MIVTLWLVLWRGWRHLLCSLGTSKILTMLSCVWKTCVCNHAHVNFKIKYLYKSAFFQILTDVRLWVSSSLSQHAENGIEVMKIWFFFCKLKVWCKLLYVQEFWDLCKVYFTEITHLLYFYVRCIFPDLKDVSCG